LRLPSSIACSEVSMPSIMAGLMLPSMSAAAAAAA
jgi:hypothetical protein